MTCATCGANGKEAPCAYPTERAKQLEAENAALRAELTTSKHEIEVLTETKENIWSALKAKQAELAEARKGADIEATRQRIAEDALTFIANEGLGQPRDDALEALRAIAATKGKG